MLYLLASLLTIQSPQLSGVVPHATESYRSEDTLLETYNFKGTYPYLKEIQIGAHGRETLNLLGEFPVLKKVTVQGDFGSFMGRFTGTFSALEKVLLSFTSAKINLDLSGQWKKKCHFKIKATTGDIRLLLPSDVGVVVKVKTTTGLVEVIKDYKKSVLGWGKKEYYNEAFRKSKVTLILEVETTSGDVYIE